MIPQSNLLATLCALAKFSVQIEAAKPYLVSLANLIASSSVSKIIQERTGPNNSS